jgi:hypothetical protein
MKNLWGGWYKGNKEQWKRTSAESYISIHVYKHIYRFKYVYIHAYLYVYI